MLNLPSQLTYNSSKCSLLASRIYWFACKPAKHVKQLNMLSINGKHCFWTLACETDLQPVWGSDQTWPALRQLYRHWQLQLGSRQSVSLPPLFPPLDCLHYWKGSGWQPIERKIQKYERHAGKYDTAHINCFSPCFHPVCSIHTCATACCAPAKAVDTTLTAAPPSPSKWSSVTWTTRYVTCIRSEHKGEFCKNVLHL